MITQTRKLYEFCVFTDDDFSRIIEALTYTDISFKNRARILRLTSPFLYRMKNGRVIGVMNSINDTLKASE